MKLEPWEPDLRTIITRVNEGEIDLQPEFQRGLAWNREKQQRLIDTVLRGWAIPPLHLLVLEDQRLAVLDGQQRLRALHDFLEGSLPIGRFEPYELNLDRFKGDFFWRLPEEMKRRVLNFKVPCYRLYDYRPDEPYELFFRLNLPTGLTQAEKRNALVGSSRLQVKRLVDTSGWSKDRVGFANGRLAYDDVVAHACIYTEERTLRLPVTFASLESYYRRDEGFAEDTIEVVGRALGRLGRSLELGPPPRLNKATLLSWLMVAVRCETDSGLDRYEFSGQLREIEDGRVSVRRQQGTFFEFSAIPWSLRPYLELYNDRASLRVNDVLSVLARDLALWRILAGLDPSTLRSSAVARMVDRLDTSDRYEGDGLTWRILDWLEDPNSWGELA